MAKKYHKDKIFIEDYRNQTIEYNVDNDKFTCDITVEDSWKTTNRKSLKAVRAEIDKFIRDNADFQPRKVLSVQYGRFEGFNLTAIRSDGKLMYTAFDSERIQTKAFHVAEQYFKVWDQDVWDKLQELKVEKKAMYDRHKKIEEELVARLKPVDLSGYKYLVKDEF